jgi:transcriptional regulator with XRE-family HTH domain
MARRQTDPLDAALGARLRLRREQLRMTQTELGKMLGVSYQQIQKYESGANRLSGSSLIAACQTLRISADELLSGEDQTLSDTEALSQGAALAESLRRIERGPLRTQAISLIEALAGLSELHRAQAALAADADLLGALPFAIYTTNEQGEVTYFNAAATAFAGRRPRLLLDRWCITHRLYREDGVFLPHDECPMAVALKEDRPIRGVRAIAERPDGVRRWFRPHPTPLHNQAGKLIGGINLFLEDSVAA